MADQSDAYYVGLPPPPSFLTMAPSSGGREVCPRCGFFHRPDECIFPAPLCEYCGLWHFPGERHDPDCRTGEHWPHLKQIARISGKTLAQVQAIMEKDSIISMRGIITHCNWCGEEHTGFLNHRHCKMRPVKIRAERKWRLKWRENHKDRTRRKDG